MPTRRRIEAATAAVRAQIAFYGSTPAYKVVLDVHGWGDLQPVLRDLTRSGDWAAMASVVHDDLLHAVAVVRRARTRWRPRSERRYGSVLDRVALNAPVRRRPGVWQQIADRPHARKGPRRRAGHAAGVG